MLHAGTAHSPNRENAACGDAKAGTIPQRIKMRNTAKALLRLPSRPEGHRPIIRYGEDPQRRGKRSLLDRPAAQGLHLSVICSTAL
jgi:hypothetical protein